MRKFIIIFLLIPSLNAWAQKSSKKQNKKNDPAVFAKTITANDLKKHLYIVASKEMEGRETATVGQRKAAAYIEGQFRSLALMPGNKGKYQLQYTVYQDSSINATVLINGLSYELDKDFYLTISQSNPATYRFSEVVF